MKSRPVFPYTLLPLVLFFLSIFTAFSLICLWEFGLEDRLFPLKAESVAEHWSYVITSTSFVIIALIIPTLVAYRLERQREGALNRLAESERRFRGLFHGSIAAKLLVEKDSGKVVEANRAAADFYDKDIGLIVGVALKELEPNAYLELSAIANSGQTLTSKIITGRNGRAMSVFIWSLEINGAPHYQIITHNITSQQLAEEDQRLLASIYANASEGIMVTDHNGFILSANEAFCRMIGQAEKELIGKTPRMLKSGKHDNHFYAEMWKSLHETGAWRGEVWDRVNNEDIKPYAVSISAMRDRQGAITKFSAIYFDISEGKELEETLRSQAELDALTGMFNRRKFDDLLKREWGRARRESHPLSLIMFDIDHFKKFNDTYGHQQGDERLRHVAMIIQESLGRPTDHAARYGGEEFVVILPSASVEGALHVAERIRRRVQEKGATEIMPLTISAGVATLTDFEVDDFNQLVLLADKALYKSKSEGRNRVTVHQTE
jgi:diguanylate cyclase (GGDEF)-like protein/PAS domain S-box-containing protein